MKKILKPIILFLIGGSIYISIEIIYRYLMDKPPTHWAMFVLGGLAFLIIGRLNEHIDWEMPFWLQALIGTAIVLVLEFIFGCVLNLWLGLAIWDYSNMPFNLLGQICLPFALIWSVLVVIAIVLDDYLRYWLFAEEKPVYYWKFQQREN
ncbi:MAG: hypothetical protein Q4F79_00480 [Eubacteriales bacterium]|nr:hypothetical protein [Eubacteriales bacterium]